MSSLWLLKLIYDADGEFRVDDIGAVEGLEMLFELQSQGYVNEESSAKTWGVTDSGEDRLHLPDHSATELRHLANPEQLEMVDRLYPMKWRVSHIWEYGDDLYAVWMIAPNIVKNEGYVHGYITPDGKFHRFEDKLGKRLA